MALKNMRQGNNDLFFPPSFHYKDLQTRFRAQGSITAIFLFFLEVLLKESLWRNRE